MAKLTAAQERSIETVLYYLEKAQAYIDQEQTVVARLKTQCTTTLDFEIPGKGAASSIAKILAVIWCVCRLALSI